MADKPASNETEVVTMLIFIAVVGLSAIVWYFFRIELTEILRWIRVGEMWVASILFGDDFVVQTQGHGTQTIGIWRSWLPKADVNIIGIPEIIVTTQVALAPLKAVISVLLFLMGLMVTFSEPGKKYYRKFNLQELMAEQAKSFPTIHPFIEFNPLKANHRVLGKPVPKKLPLFAEALSPEEWVAYNRIRFEGGKLDRAKAYRAFARQLGRRWRGPEYLPLYAQGLYVAFALKSRRKRDAAEEMLGELAEAWSAKKGFNPSSHLKRKIKKSLADKSLCSVIRDDADKHAFNTSALLACLAKARAEGGVLAPASFLWLRGVDRDLWYPLNNLGRKAFHPEASGAMIHYIYEVVAGQKIPTPQVEDAIKNLESLLKQPDARPIPPIEGEENSVSVARG